MDKKHGSWLIIILCLLIGGGLYFVRDEEWPAWTDEIRLDLTTIEWNVGNKLDLLDEAEKKLHVSDPIGYEQLRNYRLIANRVIRDVKKTYLALREARTAEGKKDWEAVARHRQKAEKSLLSARSNLGELEKGRPRLNLAQF